MTFELYHLWDHLKCALEAFWEFKPNSGYVETSFGINVASAVYPPILNFVMESCRNTYAAKAETLLGARKYTDEQKRLLTVHQKRLAAGLVSLGEKSIRDARKYAMFMALVCMIVLYCDCMRGPVIFLPITPIVFGLMVRKYAARRWKKFNSDVAAYARVCEPGDDDEREIADAIGK